VNAGHHGVAGDLRRPHIGIEMVYAQRNRAAGTVAKSPVDACVAGCSKRRRPLASSVRSVAPVLPTEFRVQTDGDVAEVIMCMRYTGFSHRHLGPQRIDRPTEQT